MKISWLISFIIFLFLAILPMESYAARPGDPCTVNAECPKLTTPDISLCKYSATQKKKICVVATGSDAVFGGIDLPPALNQLGGGSVGISNFLNNLINLIYTTAFVVFIFMLLWGGLQWISSGGDKEAVGAARERIIHALIGIVLFAIAFAIIQIVEEFTGWQFII